LNKLPDVLTYSTDLSGRRKLRIYVKAAIFIAVALLVALAIVLGQQFQSMRAMAAVATINYKTPPTQHQELTPTPKACPSDPGDWQFVGSGIPGDGLEHIKPACVYENLGRTVAWVLAIREGYSRSEAGQMLGFTQPPAQTKLSDVKVLNPVGNPWIASLVMVPLTAGYSEWHIDGRGLPAVDYFPQGCFRGSDTRIDEVGNKVPVWNGSYPVVCSIIEDDIAANLIMSLNGRVFSASSSPTRSLLYFGYDTGTKQWVWLGIDENLHYSSDVTGMPIDPKSYSGQYGGYVWDAQWLSRAYGLEMKALPDHWQSAQDRAEMQAILDSINSSNAQ
jgi:hypothetical protein